jgi:pimeloyl-ACP methyl ester carboxylesterase
MPLIDLSDVRLHYEIRGRGPAVLLISGLGQLGRNWDPVVPHLSKSFSVIQLDNRGIGQSIARRPARLMEDYASDYVELLDRLQIDKAHVVGLSFGGVAAQRLAADHAGRINRLVLISTTDRTSPYLGHIGLLLGHALRHFSLKLFFQTVELLANSPEYFDKNAMQILGSIPTRSGGWGTRRTLANQLRCLHAASIAPKRGDITAPTLVLAGEYDALIPNCYGRQLAASLKDGQFAVIKSCGHNPIIEQPDVTAHLIERFLAAGEVFQQQAEPVQQTRKVEEKQPRELTPRGVEFVVR